MSEWTRWLLLGCLSVLFGALALGNAVAVSFAITLVTGSLLILAGAIQVCIGFYDDGGRNKFISLVFCTSISGGAFAECACKCCYIPRI